MASVSRPGADPTERTAGRLVLVRHGRTEWSQSGRHTGRTDIALTDHGVEQARALAGALPVHHVALTLTSPRRRARETARLAGLGEPEVTDDLAEWDYGDYEGLTREEIRSADPDWTIWTGPTPGGETSGQVVARADRVLARSRDALPHGDVVLVTHGHLGRVLALRWLDLPLSTGAVLDLHPASPSVLADDRGQPVIAHWNIPNPVDRTR